MGFFSSSSSSSNENAPLNQRPDPVLPNALDLPLFNKLRGKRIVLASASPRRLEILKTFGLQPEVVPSTFPEELSHADYDDASQYCVATCSAKAVEVYEKLVSQSPEDPPDVVIGGDTVVVLPPPSLAILEKPRSKADQMGMLQDYNGSEVSVITAVTLGMWTKMSNQSLVTESKVVFAENSPTLLKAYVASGEGLDRAGGFAIQGMGGLLIKEIKGDYNNCVGFPGQAFFQWLAQLTEDGTLCEMD